MILINCLLHLLSEVRTEKGAQGRNGLQFHVSLHIESVANDRFLLVIHSRE